MARWPAAITDLYAPVLAAVIAAVYPLILLLAAVAGALDALTPTGRTPHSGGAGSVGRRIIPAKPVVVDAEITGIQTRMGSAITPLVYAGRKPAAATRTRQNIVCPPGNARLQPHLSRSKHLSP